MITAQDLKRVRWSILAALLMAGAGAAAAYATHQATLEARAAATRAEAKQKEARNRLMRARDEQAEITAKIGRFGDLAAIGVVGEERRLEWVERIREIRSARRLYDLQYEIAPQRPLDAAAAPGSSGSFEFLSSTMRLQMDLLHEVDLIHFLDDLEHSVSAFVRPQSCTVERTGLSGSTGAGALLRAECTLDWITIRERKNDT
jgi:hypothetical protein